MNIIHGSTNEHAACRCDCACPCGAGEVATVRRDSGLAETVRALAIAFALCVPVFVVSGSYIYSGHAARYRASHAFAMLVGAPAGETVDADAYLRGRGVFQGTCVVCHGADATGVTALGKDLAHSNFVASVGDEDLAAFIERGREAGDPESTTRRLMPAKGGNLKLERTDLRDAVAYLRAVQDPRRAPRVTAEQVAAAEAASAKAAAAATLDLAAATGATGEDAEWLHWGREKFASTCTACHAADGTGVKGAGKDLTSSEFVRGLDDDELLAFLKRGRDPGDPLNTTKVAMPPKGGNPALDDDDLYSLVRYVRALQKTEN
jgi:disulfide bond formation protein DsbB